ncbi:hypothetical protein [Geobacillus thermodenitrificans]|uniref:hypothetical protein n=1 Tax=Geobacillus thermodenitrificans TaxID=33940 RepID=UPI0011B1E932|nr:hypothetical protein [Geobacillus thermodenitrificans]MED3718685.1 hypothetical protein [Geobacillus thermodenitrificans]MED3906725.1 hypothetical protein [Geobacillus thermodenitrificans]
MGGAKQDVSPDSYRQKKEPVSGRAGALGSSFCLAAMLAVVHRLGSYFWHDYAAPVRTFRIGVRFVLQAT